MNKILIRLEIIDKRLGVIEDRLQRNTHISREVLTYTKRIQAYIKSAMVTLHSSFKMIVNGILNLREEHSEFAGNVLNNDLDTDFL